MRIALAEDSALFRDGLVLLLKSAGVDVVAAARTGVELCAELDRGLAIDAAVLDMHMPPTFTDEGLVTASRVRMQAPSAAIVVLSTYAESEYAAQLLERLDTNVGYLLKDRVAHVGVLIDALERVSQGESVIEPEIVRGLLDRQRRSKALARFTEREREVLMLLAQGRSNLGIARQLHFSVKTVERHIASIFLHTGIAECGDDNRRVLAVLMWLRENHG